jgi:undecaprenyl-diphosphatase
MISRLLLCLLLLIAVTVAGLLGGSASGFDQSIVRFFIGWRLHHAAATQAIIILTYLGGAPALIAVGVIAAVGTAISRKADAFMLLCAALGGRVLIEGMKWAVSRPRPSLDAHPVSVFSQSFPSAHAGNSMVTYGAIALFALPERWRAAGLIAAVLLSLLIGSTRPILGVHWPTDVVGGWCLGALWLLVCWTLREQLSRRAT